MWDLIFRIGGDTSPIKRDIDRLGPHFEKAGKKIGERFHLGLAHGVAAIAIGAGVAIQRALGESIGDAVKALKESARLGTTLEEYSCSSAPPRQRANRSNPWSRR